MKQRVGALVVLLGMLVAGLLVQPTAAQAVNTAPRPSVVTGSQSGVDQGTTAGTVLQGCYVTPKGRSVSVRRSPSTGATRIGIIYSGQRADAACTATSGGYYSDCGGSSWWVRVTWTGATGYVAEKCVNWYRN